MSRRTKVNLLDHDAVAPAEVQGENNDEVSFVAALASYTRAMQTLDRVVLVQWDDGQLAVSSIPKVV